MCTVSLFVPLHQRFCKLFNHLIIYLLVKSNFQSVYMHARSTRMMKTRLNKWPEVKHATKLNSLDMTWQKNSTYLFLSAGNEPKCPVNILEIFYIPVHRLFRFLKYFSLGIKIILRQDFMDVLRVGIRSGKLKNLSSNNKTLSKNYICFASTFLTVK